MRSYRMFSLALMVGGLTVSSAWAQSDYGPRAAAPGLLPLPEISTAWANGDNYPSGNYASRTSVTDVAPDESSSDTTWYHPRGNGDWRQNPQSWQQPNTPQATTPVATPVTTPPVNMPLPPPMTPPDVYNALQTPAGGAGCGGECGCNCGCGCGPSWYGWAGGLVMTRNAPNKYFTTDNETNNHTDLDTDKSDPKWRDGGEIGIGYNFGCNCGIQFLYWGLGSMNGVASITSATNSLGTPLDTTNGSAGLLLGGQTPDAFMTNAHEVLLFRDDSVNNAEINFTYCPCGADCCSCLSTTWLYGFRFFNFQENLLWTSVAGGFNYGDAGGADQANINIECQNELYGFQVGTLVNYKLTKRLSIFGMPKLGIYGDYATAESRYYRGDGIVGFDIKAHSDTVSFLGSMDLGLNYQIGQHFSVVGGYRVVAVSGIALSDNQIPHFLAAADEFESVKTNADLIVHGMFLGATFSF